MGLAWSVSGMNASVPAASLLEFFAGENTIRVAIDLAGLAIAGSFLVVPTFTAVQIWTPKERRARFIAAVNILSAGFMTMGSALVAAIQLVGVSIAQILAGLALANGIAAWLMLRYLPTIPLRDFVSILFLLFTGWKSKVWRTLPRRVMHPF